MRNIAHSRVPGIPHCCCCSDTTHRQDVARGQKKVPTHSAREQNERFRKLLLVDEPTINSI